MPAQQEDPPWPDFQMPAPLMDWIGDLYDWLKENRPVAGDGITITDADGGGKSISAGNGTGGTAAANQPFKLLDSSDDSGHKIRVVYGTVNSMIPDGMSPGDTPTYILDVPDDEGYVYLEVTTDEDGNIDSVSIGIASTIPDDTDGDYHWQIGSYFVDPDTDNMSLAQSIGGSQMFELCGGVEPLWGLT